MKVGKALRGTQRQHAATLPMLRAALETLYAIWSGELFSQPSGFDDCMEQVKCETSMPNNLCVNVCTSCIYGPSVKLGSNDFVTS